MQSPSQTGWGILRFALASLSGLGGALLANAIEDHLKFQVGGNLGRQIIVTFNDAGGDAKDGRGQSWHVRPSESRGGGDGVAESMGTEGFLKARL